MLGVLGKLLSFEIVFIGKRREYVFNYALQIPSLAIAEFYGKLACAADRRNFNNFFVVPGKVGR